MIETWKVKLAQQAFEAYGVTVNLRNYEGKPIPEWADLPLQIQQGWVAVVQEVVERYQKLSIPKTSTSEGGSEG